MLEWVAVSSPGDLPNSGIERRSLTLQVDSLPAEPQGKAIKKQNNLLFFVSLNKPRECLIFSMSSSLG